MSRVARVLWQAILVAWASPATLLGLAVGVTGLLAGGTLRRVGPTIECGGGWFWRFLDRFDDGLLGMTLGHVVLARNDAALEVVRPHERIHVRQYERWGPFFLPAYLLCAAWLYARGRNGYRENPFEREAFGD